MFLITLRLFIRGFCASLLLSHLFPWKGFVININTIVFLGLIIFTFLEWENYIVLPYSIGNWFSSIKRYFVLMKHYFELNFQIKLRTFWENYKKVIILILSLLVIFTLIIYLISQVIQGINAIFNEIYTKIINPIISELITNPWNGATDNEKLKSIVTLLGFAGTALTILLAWFNIKQSFDKQITDRFTAAVNQLEKSDKEITLGGIYALETIAKESKKKYAWTIMEILCAFIRHRSLEWKKEAEAETLLINKKLIYPPLPEDIQAALTVIGRRNVNRKTKTSKLDLTNSFFNKVDFKGANLREVNFEGSILSGAILEDADLTSATLDGAELVEACLKNAKLDGASFRNAILQKASLISCSAKKTNFDDADLSRADLTQSRLYEASFIDANLNDVEGDEQIFGLTIEQLEFAKYDSNKQFLDYQPI